MTATEITAQIIGFVAAGAYIFSYQFRSVKPMFILQFIGSVLFTTHFLMLGAYSGAMQNGLSIIRGFLLMNTGKKWAINRYTLAALTVAYIVCGIVMYSGIFSILPVIAMIVSTAVMWSGDGYKIRIAQATCISPCWLIYNISVFSISGIITETFNIISVIVSFIRYGKKFGK